MSRFAIKIRPYDDETDEPVTNQKHDEWENPDDEVYDNIEDAVAAAKGDYTRYDGGELVVVNLDTNEVTPAGYDSFSLKYNEWQKRDQIKDKHSAMLLLSKKMAEAMNELNQSVIDDMQAFANKHGLPFAADQYRVMRAAFRNSNPYWDSSSASC